MSLRLFLLRAGGRDKPGVAGAAFVETPAARP